MLDEPGNHLDVETVEALANALLEYRGTVLFTSHDRYFMRRIASLVIEVREGSVRNYNGDYEAYLYAVNKEVDDGQRARTASREQQRDAGGAAKRGKDDRKRRKEISNVERKIARLDEEKKSLQQRLLQTTDAEEAVKLHTEVEEISGQLTAAEDRWMELQEDA